MRQNRPAGLMGIIFTLAWLASCGGSSGSSSGSSGRNAYLAIPQANAIAAYRVDTSSGNFKPVLGSPFSGGTSPISIAVHPSGKFVYAANQGSNDISLFKIDSNTGELTEVMPRTAAGLNPAALVMDSGGDLIFVANQTSNNISVFSVSASDGTLIRSARVAVCHGRQGRWRWRFRLPTSFSTWEAEIWRWCSAIRWDQEQAVCWRFRARRSRFRAHLFLWRWILPGTSCMRRISAPTRCQA